MQWEGEIAAFSTKHGVGAGAAAGISRPLVKCRLDQVEVGVGQPLLKYGLDQIFVEQIWSHLGLDLAYGP